MSKIRLTFACLSVLLLSSCTLIGSKDEIGYFPVKLEKDGRWSMIGPDGKILFQDEFEVAPTLATNGVFVVLEGETYSVYRASEKPELIIDDLRSVGAMSEGLIPIVKKDSRITLIDIDGNEKFVLESYDGMEIVECDNRYSEGLLAVKTENNKWGYINKDGDMVISPKYDGADSFRGDYAIVYINKNDSNDTSRYIINKKGETVLEINKKYKSNSYKTEIKDGLMQVYDSAKEKIGFLNIKGEFISVPSKVVSILDFNNEVFVFDNKEGKCGVMSLDKDNAQLICPKYDIITIISSNEFLVKDNDKYYVVNNEDEKILDFSDYDFVMPSPISTTQSYIAQEGNVSVLLDKEGKQLGNLEFYEVCGDESYYYELSCYDWYVYSDYFNPQSITDVIEDCLTTYVLGESMAKYVTNPQECDLNSYHYSVSNFDKKGCGNDINLFLISDLPYVKSHPKLYNTKAINANSKLKEINIELHKFSGCSVWNHSEKIHKHVANILESKGFKKEKDNELEKELVKDNVHVNMSLSHDSGYLIHIYKTNSNALLFGGWGEIANVRCRIDLDFTSGKGTLSYDTKGSKMFFLNISEYVNYGGVKTYEWLTIDEYDFNGNHTGQMSGEYYSYTGEYRGTYYRKDGKNFYFEFSLTKQ